MKTLNKLITASIIAGAVGVSANAWALDVSVSQWNSSATKDALLDMSGQLGNSYELLTLGFGNKQSILYESGGWLNLKDTSTLMPARAEQQNTNSGATAKTYFYGSNIDGSLSSDNQTYGNITNVSAPNATLKFGEGSIAIPTIATFPNIASPPYEQRNFNTSQESELFIGKESTGTISGVMAGSIEQADTLAIGNTLFSDSAYFNGDITQYNNPDSNQTANVEISTISLDAAGKVAPTANTIGNTSTTLGELFGGPYQLIQYNLDNGQASSIAVEAVSNNSSTGPIDHEAVATATGNTSLAGAFLLGTADIHQFNVYRDSSPLLPVAQSATISYDTINDPNGDFDLTGEAVGNDLAIVQGAIATVNWSQLNDATQVSATGPAYAQITDISVTSVSASNDHTVSGASIGNRAVNVATGGTVAVDQINNKVLQRATVTYNNVTATGLVQTSVIAGGNTSTILP